MGRGANQLWREPKINAPNLFSYATTELSQDAVICWLVEWSGHDGANGMTQLGRQFVESLLNHKRYGPNVTLKGGFLKVEIHRQEKHIDVLARIDGKHVLLIEDKTDSEPHGDQLATYRNAVLARQTKLGCVSEEDLFAIYFKSGNHALATERKIEKDSRYRVFNRADFLSVLAGYVGDNAILSDFRDHLASIECQTQSFRKWRRTDCERDRTRYAREGLYRELERCLFVANSDRPWRGWGYVPNASGGFMGFWWLPAELPDDHCAYLQLEHEKLCFKVWAGDSSTEKQDELKWEWNARITGLHERVVKPPVMRRGGTMTVAVHEDGWLRYDDEGVLSLDRTVEVLREAEQVLLAAARASRGD